jgi:hypothetical protein
MHLGNVVLATALAVAVSAPALAANGRYRVTVTNITAGQTFTPILIATHRPAASFFELGEPASPGLEFLAEEGGVAPLRTALDASPAVSATEATTGLLAPGETATLHITARPGFNVLSLAAMLIPTNDSFVALDRVDLPRNGSVTFEAEAYDAGTEPNTELCADIPGPFCGGAGTPTEGAEGFVHISRGISGVGEGAGPPTVTVAAHDWRNPVAEITIRRVQ